MINMKEKREREIVRQSKKKGTMVSGIKEKQDKEKIEVEEEEGTMCGRGEHACTSSLLFSAGDILSLHKRLSENIAGSVSIFSLSDFLKLLNFRPFRRIS